MSTITYAIASGTGKVNHEIAKLESHPRPDVNVFVLSRKEVETRDYTRYMATFGPFSSQADIRQIHSRILLTFSDYDDTDAELFEIPAVRDYCDMIDWLWPGWLYFSNLESDCLKVIAACSLTSLIAARTKGTTDIALTLNQSELHGWVNHCIPTAVALQRLGGTKSDAGIQKSAIRYFGLDAAAACG